MTVRLIFMLNQLNALYDRYNRKQYVHPDPVELLYPYKRREDREIAGLIASSLAYGKVCRILKSVSIVLERMGDSPHSYLLETSESEIGRQFQNFVHRFATGANLSSLLVRLKNIIEESGSAYGCFLEGVSPSDETILPAMSRFTERILKASAHGTPGHLIASPAKKSACKRMNLFLRWMVRCDAVDPGGWDKIPASKLLIPLDVHMHRISLALGLTSRKQANLQTAMEITEKFRQMAPEDPVRFDFALTRFGIRDDLSIRDVCNFF